MIYRQLGKSGIDVGVIGVGTEHIVQQPPELAARIVGMAVDAGVNYFDLLLMCQEARDNLCAALRGVRSKVLLAAHFGQFYQEGAGNRDPDKCEAALNDLLAGLGTDYVDVLFLHNVDADDDYERAFDRNGYLGRALRLRQAGKARLLAISTHNTLTATRAIQTGLLDALMFPINPAHDLLPGALGFWKKDTFAELAAGASDLGQDRRRLYLACERMQLGLIAMKPYAGGLLLHGGYPSDAFAGSSLAESKPAGMLLTPAQCLSYALSQPGVTACVPGIRRPEELLAALAYLDGGEAARDFSAIQASPLWKLGRRCVYCDHCLPCPAGIPIGDLMRLLDIAEHKLDAAVVARYRALERDASDCTACRVCEGRCPFDVAVIERMERAVEIFAGAS